MHARPNMLILMPSARRWCKPCLRQRNLQLLVAPARSRKASSGSFKICGYCQWACFKPTVVFLADLRLILADVHGMGLCSFLMSLGSVNGTEADLAPTACLGDFLDRGWQGPETIALVAQLIVSMGDNFWLVRGNHEVSRKKGMFEV